MDAEKCLADLGGDNRWILMWFFLISYMKSLPCVFAMFSFQFTGFKPKSFHCSLPENASMEEMIPKEFVNGEWRFSSCMQYLNNSNTTIVPCQNGYNYTMEYFTSSIVTEWDLVCDREILNSLCTSAFFVMSFLGAIISCSLADRYGRKVVLLIAFTCLNTGEFVQGFVTNIYVLIFFKLIAGIFQQGCYITGFTMTIELFSLKNRSNACLVDSFSWTISCLVLIIYVYLIRDWRYYFIWTSISMVPFVLIFYFIPESIRWLLNKSRVKEARKLLETAAKYSKPPLSKDHFVSINSSKMEKDDDPPIYNITHICRERLLLRYQVINSFIWYTTALTFYGLQIKVVEIGNPFINFFLSSLVEVPAHIYCFPIANKYGRKLTIGITNFLVCLCLIGGYVLLKTLDSAWPAIAILLFGKMLNTGAFDLIFMHVSEFFPTTLRTTAVGMSSSAARIGASSAALIFQTTILHPSVPFVIITILCFICGVVVFGLPETYRKKMPTTIEEIKEWVHDKPIMGFR